jgi:hypothetical protein
MVIDQLYTVKWMRVHGHLARDRGEKRLNRRRFRRTAGREHVPTALHGHVALVTGAGRGIGRAHALLMAERGAAVVVSDIGVGLDGIGLDASVAQGVVDEITAAGGCAVADTNDISSFEGAAAAVQTGVRAFGKVDVVVNNAGLPGGAAIEDITEEQLRRAFALHVQGPIGAVKAAWPMMAAQRWGRVIRFRGSLSGARRRRTQGPWTGLWPGEGGGVVGHPRTGIRGTRRGHHRQRDLAGRVHPNERRDVPKRANVFGSGAGAHCAGGSLAGLR